MACILIVVPRFHPNLFFATRALQEAGHRVAVFANQAAPGEDHRHLSPQVFGKTPRYGEVRDAMADLAPDLVLLRNSVSLNRHAARAARRLGVAAWRYNQTDVTRPTPWPDRVELWLKGLPQRRVSPVRGRDPQAPPAPNAAYLPWPVARLGSGGVPHAPDGPLRLLAVGRFGAPRKNHLALLEALIAAGLMAQVSLRLVGLMPGAMTPSEAEYHSRVKALAEEHGVKIIANLPFDQMPELYNWAQAVLLPSTYETLGIAPVEGMAYGAVPVISTVAGAAGYVVPGVNGLHVEAERPETFAEAVGALVADRDLVARLSAGALETVATELSPARFVARMRRF